MADQIPTPGVYQAPPSRHLSSQPPSSTAPEANVASQPLNPAGLHHPATMDITQEMRAMPPPPRVEHVNNYYIPRDEIVRAIPLGGEPSMGMSAPYKTNEVRAFEVAATYGRVQRRQHDDYSEDDSDYASGMDSEENRRARRNRKKCTRCGRPCKFCHIDSHSSDSGRGGRRTESNTDSSNRYRRDRHHKRDLKPENSDRYTSRDRRDRDRSLRENSRDRRVRETSRDPRDQSRGHSRGRDSGRDHRRHTDTSSAARREDDLIVVVGREVTRDQLRRMDPALRDKLIRATRPKDQYETKSRSAGNKNRREKDRKEKDDQQRDSIKIKDRRGSDYEEHTPIQEQRDFPPQLTHHYFHHYPELPSHKTNPFTLKTAVPLQRNLDVPNNGVQALHHFPMTERNAALLKSAYPANPQAMEQTYDHLRISTFELANNDQKAQV